MYVCVFACIFCFSKIMLLEKLEYSLLYPIDIMLDILLENTLTYLFLAIYNLYPILSKHETFSKFS